MRDFGWRNITVAAVLLLLLIAATAGLMLNGQPLNVAAWGIERSKIEAPEADGPAAGALHAQLAQNAPPARPQRPPAALGVPGAPEATPGRGAAASAEDSRAPSAPPAAPPAAPPPQIPTRTEILNFDNWVVTCNEFAEGARKRVCQAVLQIAQQNTNQVVFNWTIALDNSRQLVAIMQTPTGVAIAPGVELRIGKSPARKVPFTSCETGRCIATAPLDGNLVRDMTTNPTAEAVIQGSQGNTVQFNIQMKGFDRAYAVLIRS